MIINVDARKHNCPEPVIMTKKAMAEDHEAIVVLVDNKIAVENIKRFAKKNSHGIKVEEVDGDFKLTLTEE